MPANVARGLRRLLAGRTKGFDRLAGGRASRCFGALRRAPVDAEHARSTRDVDLRATLGRFLTR